MSRNFKHNLTILAASAVLGVAAGILIAPRPGRDSRRNLKQGLRRVYRGPAREQPAPAVLDRPSAPPQPLVVSGPYPHS